MSPQRSTSSASDSRQQQLDQLRGEIVSLSERLNHTREFAQTAAHALKSPLISMHGYIGILNQEYADALDLEGRELLQRVGQLIEEAVGVVSSVLEYSLLDSFEEHRQSVSMREVAQAAIELNHRSLEEFRVEVEVAADLPWVSGDRDMLVLVLSNLVANAAQAVRSREQGHIKIHWRDQGKEVRVLVTDNGIGIARREQRNIFKPFRRLTSRPAAGLGLSTARKIVQRHGGKIGVESLKNKGATFWFTVAK